MAGNSLYPAFFRLFYRVLNLPHVQTIPTGFWSPPSEGHPNGTFTSWASAQIDADDMIQGFAAIQQDFFNEDATLDQYIIYTLPAPNSPPQPRSGNDISLTGTNTDDGWFLAVQQTNVWRDAEFKVLKIVMLEVPTTNDFGKTTVLPGSGPLFDLDAYITDENQSFSSRNGERPLTYLSTTETLNEKLRAERRLT